MEQQQRIRTIGLYQPFAGLMLHGKIESRLVQKGRKAPFPLGRYLIYATKRKYHDIALKTICGTQYFRAVEVSSEESYCLLRGQALCVGDLVEVFDFTSKEETDKAYVDFWNYYRTGRLVGLRFENMKRIKPFPIKGKQGIGFLSPEDEAEIEYV